MKQIESTACILCIRHTAKTLNIRSRWTANLTEMPQSPVPQWIQTHRLRVIFWLTRAVNLWGHHNLVIIAYFSLNMGKMITENLYIFSYIPWWISPKSLRKWVVSLRSTAYINHPPHPALFYQNMTLIALCTLLCILPFYENRIFSVRDQGWLCSDSCLTPRSPYVIPWTSTSSEKCLRKPPNLLP